MNQTWAYVATFDQSDKETVKTDIQPISDFVDINALRMCLRAIRFTFATQSSSCIRSIGTRSTTVRLRATIPIKTGYRLKMGSFSPSGEGEVNSQQ